MRRSRTFAAVYALGAVLLAFFQVRGDGAWPATLPWMGVCLSAAALGVCVAAKRPMTLLNAAHAGLTATWAGSLAGKALESPQSYRGEATSLLAVGLLVALAVGMGVLVTIGMRVFGSDAAQASRQV